MTVEAPVIYYKINGKQTPPSLRLLGLKHYMQSDMIRKCEFMFENSDRRLELTSLKNLLASGNKIQFSYGYLNNMSRVYEYEIRGHTGSETMTVTAYQKVDETRRSVTYKKSKYSDAIKLIAARNGWKTDKIQDTKCAESQFKQTEESDLKFAAKLAKKIGFEFGLDEKTLIFRERRYNGKASHVFVDRGRTITNDILKFTPKLNTFQIPVGYQAVYINNKNAKRETTDADTSKVKRPLLGGDAGVAGLGSGSDGSQVGTPFNLGKPQKVVKQNAQTLQITPVKGKGLKTVPVVKKQKSRKKKDQNCSTEALFKIAEDTIFKADLEVFGEPKIYDKELIELQNVGVDNEGLWYVYDVIHEIESTYLCKIKLERNTVGFAKYTGTGTGAGKPNNGKPTRITPGSRSRKNAPKKLKTKTTRVRRRSRR